MDTMVQIEEKGAVALVRMTNGVTNSINPDLVAQLAEAVETVRGSFKGMVLAGGPKFFSIGLDLPCLLALEQEKMESFWANYNRLVLNLYTLPMPTACVVGGHATAGGMILALTTDYRFIAEGRKLMGLNEVRIGVPVPWLAELMLRQLIAERDATDLIYTGELFDGDTASRLGLVDEVCNPEDLEEAALEKISTLSALPQQAFRQVKVNRVEPFKSAYLEKAITKDKGFLDCWFATETQALLEEAAKKF